MLKRASTHRVLKAALLSSAMLAWPNAAWAQNQNVPAAGAQGQPAPENRFAFPQSQESAS